MNDDLGALERLLQRGAIAHVALAVGHLRPTVLVRAERAPRDPDDLDDPLVGLQQRHKAEAEGPGRTGNRNGEARFGQLGVDLCAGRPLSADVSLVELDGLYEGARAEESLEHALFRLAAHRPGPRRIVEQVADRGTVGGEVERIVEQDSCLTVDDLVLDAPDATGYDRARFPHRLRDREPEALG